MVQPKSRANARPLRLLYVVHGFPPDTWAGTEVHTLELALEMRRRGHEPIVAARAPAREGEADWSLREDSFQGLRVLRVARRVEGLPLGDSYRPAAARAVFAELCERLRPELVHFQHLLHLSIEWIELARERGLPSVYTANDYWPLCARVQLQRPDGVRCEENQELGCIPCVKNKDPRLVPIARRLFPVLFPLVSALDRVARPGKRLARFTRSWIDLAERQPHVLRCLAAADLVVAPSRFLRAKLLATGRLDPERVLHSDYGMRPARPLPKAPDPEGKLRIGFVGSFVPYKGAELLLEAARRLRERPVRVELFGAFEPEREPYHARLAALAQGLPVRFHGRFDNARLAEVYARIDLLVVPSTWFENSPLVIHEAFLHETPVVTSDIGGMAELVRDGVYGLHFRAGDAKALASCLERFLDEPGLLARFSRDFPRYRTPAEQAEELEAHYLELLTRATAARPR